ncbi:predicted protein [Naegleria gruberi]|uniref:Predicted protein n=1 Tax=Naegleria gruberi TaxID=5762 RepID=D2VYM3_NAEGR|nr:uncharacterized protein NAEGRDRAFT_81726 [Naegleria gruberi]EFC38139.1 predicted protein [Naegleria gruberi]|eukprot:XP_002670883.1 predicted protein [Naegleria gruberi strain NEG-M]
MKREAPFSASEPLIYPRIETLDQVIENIGTTRGFVIQSNNDFTFVSYKVVSSDSFPFIPHLIDENTKQLNINLDSYEEIERRLLRREIRGLCFDRESRRIVGRSMPKFFNVDEKEETNFKIIEKLISELKKKTGKERPFTLLEKLDGSLCTPIIEFLKDDSGEKKHFRLRFRTKLDYQNDHSQSIEEFVYELEKLNLVKGQSSDVSEQDEINREYHEKRKKLHESKLPLFAIESVKDGRECESTRDIPFVIDFGMHSLEDQLKDKGSYAQLVKFCVEWMNRGYTPLFEYFSPDHRVVVNYGNKPFISLLALRHTILGSFIPYEEMKSSCKGYGIECVKSCENPEIISQTDMKGIKKAIEDEKGHEGYVMVLSNGYMYKIKSDWYLNIHKTNEMLITESMREGRIWFMIFDNKLDDVLPHVHSLDHKARLEEFNDKVLYHLNRTIDYMMSLVKKIEMAMKDSEEKNTNILFVNIAKEVCKNEKTSYFLNAILKCRGLLEKKKSNSETVPPLETQDSEVASVLLEVFIGYMKPLLKKIETVREAITFHVGLLENDNSTKYSYNSQEEAIKDLILFNSNNHSNASSSSLLEDEEV